MCNSNKENTKKSSFFVFYTLQTPDFEINKMLISSQGAHKTRKFAVFNRKFQQVRQAPRLYVTGPYHIKLSEIFQ